MATSEHLREIMSAQVDLMEALVEALTASQQALVRSDSDALAQSTGMEENLLRPFHALERERERCMSELGGPAHTMTILLENLPAGERGPLEALVKRMRAAAARILDLNGQNRLLIRNARQFVQETLRIVTDDHRRQLVDERI